MKKILLIIAIIIILPIAYYLISPLFTVIEVNEELPFRDSFDSMDENTLIEFIEQTDLMKDIVVEMSDTMPSNVRIIAQGNFKPRAHEVDGIAKLISIDDKKVLRFEDFETVNGPELRIYLSADIGNQDFIDLGKIKATKGNVNYDIPPNTDTEKYNKVLVWCRPFGVLFSYSMLT